MAKIAEPVVEKDTASPSKKSKVKRKKRAWTKPPRPQHSKTQAVNPQLAEKSEKASKKPIEDSLSDGSPVLNTVRKRFVLHDSVSDTPLAGHPTSKC